MPDYRLDGRNPLGYMGVKPYTPPQMIVRKFAPTVKDVQGYALGTQWLHYMEDTPDDSIQYVLVGVAQKVATWIPLNGGGDDPTLPDHSVALGTGVAGLNSTGPVASENVPLVSNGVNADPAFGISSVAGGGTGLNAVTAYSVVTGGTTGNGPLQTVNGLGTAGQVLTSNGLGILPTWQDAGSGGPGGPIAVQVFTTPGANTYTPTAGMGSCIVELIGGGGGGGVLVTETGGAGGGGSGGYSKKLFFASDIGASAPLVIGAGGTSGFDGDASTFGTGPVLTANPGLQGTSGTNGLGGDGGTATGGDINITGGSGGSGSDGADAAGDPAGIAGFGGSNLYGGGALGYSSAATDSNGVDGSNYGSGGSGGVRETVGDSDGGSGANGVCIITEYGPLNPTPPPSGGATLNIIVLDTPGAGTYTPTAGMTQCVVECIGGGGGATAYNTVSIPFAYANGGGGGGYCMNIFDAGTIGASQPYVIGAGAAAIPTPITQGTSQSNPGDDTTFSSAGNLMTAGGGQGGTLSVAGAGGTATGGILNIPGQQASPTFNFMSYPGGLTTNYINVIVGPGGSSGRGFGFGGASLQGSFTPGTPQASINGNPGTIYGGGSSAGIFLYDTTTGLGAQAGAGGVIIITEYIAS